MTTSPTATFLAAAIDRSSKTQRQISQEIGLPKPNALSMMKLGQCRVPIERIPALSRACGVDAAAFLRIAMQEYHPEAWQALQDAFPGPLEDEELQWLEVLRTARLRQKIDLTGEVRLAVLIYLMNVSEKMSRRRQ